MTIKELIPKLIEHYEKCINKMPEEGWYNYLHEELVACGICAYLYDAYGYVAIDTPFIKEFTGGKLWLDKLPRYAISYSEAKELLQIRLNRLKEFL